MNKNLPYPPPEMIAEKLNKFRAAYEIYFKSQHEASRVLKVGQGTISRYLSGQTPVSSDSAQRFEDYTKGLIRASDIYFDIKAYRFNERLKQKQAQDHAQKVA